MIGAFVKEVLCAVLHFFSNLVEMITIVLDNCDTSLESFPQVCLPQCSTSTLLVKPSQVTINCSRTCMPCQVIAAASCGVTSRCGQVGRSNACLGHVGALVTKYLACAMNCLCWAMFPYVIFYAFGHVLHASHLGPDQGVQAGLVR